MFLRRLASRRIAIALDQKGLAHPRPSAAGGWDGGRDQWTVVLRRDVMPLAGSDGWMAAGAGVWMRGEAGGGWWLPGGACHPAPVV